jgi:hypothetical protein
VATQRRRIYQRVACIISRNVGGTCHHEHHDGTAKQANHLLNEIHHALRLFNPAVEQTLGFNESTSIDWGQQASEFGKVQVEPIHVGTHCLLLVRRDRIRPLIPDAASAARDRERKQYVGVEHHPEWVLIRHAGFSRRVTAQPPTKTLSDPSPFAAQ